MEPENHQRQPADQQPGTPQQVHPGTRAHDHSEGSPPASAPAQSFKRAESMEQQPAPISEMSPSTPTLRWASIGDPSEQIALGDDDYVLDSYFNPQFGRWEVLVIVQPREDDTDGNDTDESRSDE